MNKEYDLVIIGAGPAGLALAQCVSHLNKKILIIERGGMIGGCHGVRRVNGLFTEHGPRVYSKTYSVFRDLLKEMNIEFDDLFTPYNFSITEIGGETIFSTLSFYELFLLGIEFIKLLINEQHGRNVILQQFLKKHNFNSESYEIIDRVCKLTDGGGADKYTLNQFLQLLNQQFFYKLYQPRLPNDKGLFKLWRTFLESQGVEFSLDTHIKTIDINKDKIDSISVFKGTSLQAIKADKYVFAIPPKNLVNIMDEFKIKNDWGDIHKFANETAYIDYISISFHWNKELKLKKVYGFPKSAWGIAFIVLNDYMKFEEQDSKTVITTAITIKDKKSPNNNKTADECNENELIEEIYLQLTEAFGEIPFPTKVLMSPGVKYNDNQWISEDTAFIMTSNKGYLPFKNNLVTNMYNLGTHNGKSLYKFTSLESAVSNSVALSKQLYSELNSSEYIKLSKTTSISDVFTLFILVLIAYLIYYGIIRYGKRKH
jgi:protoporphyrinogen oxidase